MTHDVETPPAMLPPLADAPTHWLATVAIGVVVFTLAAGAWVASSVLDDAIRDALMGVLRNDDADAALAIAYLHDGATLLATLGLVLLTRADPTPGIASRRRGRWLTTAIAALLFACVGEHVLCATRSAVTRSMTFGPAGDPVWRVVAVDAPHLAWSIAIALLLAIVGDVARRDRSATPRRGWIVPPIAWPLAASLVVVTSGPTTYAGDPSWHVPSLIPLALEGPLALLTVVGVASAEWRLIRAWHRAGQRVDAPRAIDDACVRCGYDLRGIADDAACPECGLLAGRSRTTAASPLRDAPPAWLRGISIGIVIVLLAELLGAAWPFAFDAFVMPNVRFADGSVSLFGVRVDASLAFGAPPEALALLFLAGIWLLTRPQRGGGDDRVLRGTLRAFACVPAVAFAMLLWANRLAARGRWPSAATELAAIALLTAGCAPLPALMFALLRRLAQRVLNANLAEHATIVGVGLSLTLVAIQPAAIVLDHLNIGQSEASMALLLTVTVSFILFAGWSALNCVRFARAFAKARREAKTLWTDVDRAA